MCWIAFGLGVLIGTFGLILVLAGIMALSSPGENMDRGRLQDWKD